LQDRFGECDFPVFVLLGHNSHEFDVSPRLGVATVLNAKLIRTMADGGYTERNLELITRTMNELAQEIGTMEPDDPKRTYFLKELSELTQVRRMLKSASDELIGQHMDALARELATLKPRDARRAGIVQEIIRLSKRLRES
jgi:hypothetical protein